jgi:hypothetical protein
MYTFLEEGGLYKIREGDQVIATFDEVNKSKEIFFNLKRGGGFDGETPNYFGTVHFSIDK